MRLLRVVLPLILLLSSAVALGKGTYLTLPQLLNDWFPAGQEARTLWLSTEQKDLAREHIRYDLRQARVKYWTHNGKNLWVLSEIGKEKPITFAVLTHNGVLERIEVMVFREIRGDEIRLPAFTAQFAQLKLTGNGELSGNIDGISGATYSVRSMEKVAKLALLLDRWAATPDENLH
jgi:hypothetical protein